MRLLSSLRAVPTCGVNPLLFVMTVPVATTTRYDVLVVELVVNGHRTTPDTVSSCSFSTKMVVDFDSILSSDIVSLVG